MKEMKKPLDASAVPTSKDIIELRPNQLRAHQALINKRWAIANMPTGWGKSFLLCCLAARDLQDSDRKVVVCVPQRTIAKGFASAKKIRLPSGEVVSWGIRQNLCDPTTAKIKQLVRFLSEPPKPEMQDRIVLTTHMSLACAARHLTDDEIDVCFRRTTLQIDEGHHIQAAEQGYNELGRLVTTLLNFDDPTTKILLATAYFFRGDQLPIIHDNHLVRFFRYHIPFDQYWSSLEHIKEYHYDFVTYKGSIFSEVEAVLGQAQEPTIIYCPPEGHKLLLGKSKKQFVTRIRRLCEEYLDADMWEVGKTRRKRKVVVDLVSQDHRTEKIRFIAEHGAQVAAVLTVGMFREGADWVEAARVIDLIPTSSDQDRNQRFGRIIRDAPGKHSISYFSFFPYVVDQDEESRRKHLSRLYAHFHASLVLENALQPIRVHLHTTKRTDCDESELVDPVDHLGELSEDVQESIVRECYDRLILLQEEKKLFGRSVTPQEAREAIVGVLREHDVKQHLDAMARQIVLIMRRKANVRIKTDELIAAGFDKVWSTDVFDGLIAYSAGVGGPSTLAEIRKIIGNVFEQQWFENYSKVSVLPAKPSSESSAYWWCTYNKVLHQQDRLDIDKSQLLEAISWWSWTERVEDRWDEMYERIKDLPKQPKATTREYGWVRQQRRMYHEGSLDSSKTKLLEAIPWWRWASLDGNWMEKYQGISCLEKPPQRGCHGYEWIRTQRKSYRDGRLSPDRVKLLEEVPWWKWVERETSRERGLEMLQEQISDALKNGHTKTEVRASWAATLGIGSDQIYKYLRLLPSHVRDDWDGLGNARRCSA